MKKTRFARHNNVLIPQGTGPVAIGVVALIIFILVLRFVFPGALTLAATPFWKASSLAAGAMYDASVALKSPAALQHELDDAKSENLALSNENATLNGQVTDLKALLGFRTEAAPGILANVLARPPESPYDTLVLDQGATAGVVAGAIVSGPGGVPTGTIVSVSGGSSRALLYSASGNTLHALVGAAHIPAMLYGIGAGAFDASVSKEASTTPGDPVYLGASVIGQVVRVDTDPSSPEATLRIKALVNPFTLTWVTISRNAP